MRLLIDGQRAIASRWRRVVGGDGSDEPATQLSEPFFAER